MIRPDTKNILSLAKLELGGGSSSGVKHSFKPTNQPQSRSPLGRRRFYTNCI